MTDFKPVAVSMPVSLLEEVDQAVEELQWGHGRSRFLQEAAREKLREMRRRGKLSPVIPSPEKRLA